MARRRPRLPECTHERGTGHGGVRFCVCVRCVILRYRVVRFFGTQADYPGAEITRAMAENA